MGEAQGQKVSPPPLRFRRSRRSRPSARSSQGEARCSRALNSILETCQLSIGPHKKPRIPGEGKENLAYRRATPVVAEQTEDNADAATHRIVVRRRDQPAQSKCERGPRCLGHV